MTTYNHALFSTPPSSQLRSLGTDFTSCYRFVPGDEDHRKSSRTKSSQSVKLPIHLHVVKKGKAVPLQAWSGPEGSKEVKVPRFRDNGTGWYKVVSLTHRPPLPPRKCSRYSFLLEAVSTPGSQCDQKDFMSMKNSSDTSWDRTSDPQICSTAP